MEKPFDIELTITATGRSGGQEKGYGPALFKSTDELIPESIRRLLSGATEAVTLQGMKDSYGVTRFSHYRRILR